MRFLRIMRKPTGGPRSRGATDKIADRQGWKAAVRPTRGEKSRAPVEEVHRIRVLAKRLCAYLRLFRGTAPEKALEIEEKRIRRIAESLGRVRDETVCLQTLRWLAGKENEESHRKWLREALAHFSDSARGDGDPRTIGRARIAIEARRLRLLALIDEHPPQERRLEELLRREYGKSRQAMREAVREGSPEAFHRWRKRVKRLTYQTEIFSASPRRSLARLEAKFIRLGKLLGRLQDLQVLKRWIEAQPIASERKLLPLIEGWMGRYRQETERAGGRCFRMGKAEFLSLLR